MSVEQVASALAGVMCIVGAVTAAIHRDARVAGAAFLITLLSLAVLYAVLAAPALAATVIVVALFVTVPLVVHLTVSSPGHAGRGPAVAGGALLIGGALLAVLALAIAFGEVPLNVSVRSSDGYDMAALRDLLGGRAAVAVGGSVVLLVSAVVAVRAARRARRALR